MFIIDVLLKIIRPPSLHRDVGVTLGHIMDTYAQEIKWTPITKSSNRKPWRKLRKISERRLEYKKTIEAYILSIWHTPILIFLYFFGVNSFNNPIAWFNSYAAIVIIIVIIIIILYFSLKPKVFDKNFDYYWHSYKKPRFRLFHPSDKHVKLNEIYAIQLIPRYNDPPEGGGWSYYNFEMNLVLLDKRRMNVIVHRDLRQLRDDAEILSHFLDVPIWDGVYSSSDEN